MQERRFELKDNKVTGYYMETTKKCVRNSTEGPVYPVSFPSVRLSTGSKQGTQ